MCSCIGLLLLVYNRHTKDHGRRGEGEGDRGRSPDSPVRERYTTVTEYFNHAIPVEVLKTVFDSHLCYYYCIVDTQGVVIEQMIEVDGRYHLVDTVTAGWISNIIPYML